MLQLNKTGQVTSGSRATEMTTTHTATLQTVLLGTLLIALTSCSESKTPPESYPIEAAASSKNDAIAFYKLVTSLTASCDLAGGIRIIAMQGGDPVTVYQAAKTEDSLCLQVTDKLENLQIPLSLGRPVAIRYARVIDRCKTAYLSQWSAVRALESALDNGGKVGNLATYRDREADMLAENSDCSKGLISAAAPLGITRADLIAEPKRPVSAEDPASLPIENAGTDSSPVAAPADDSANQSATTKNLTEYKFSDFPSSVYSGPWKAPNFSGAQRRFRQFRTMIANGAKQGPVFAGTVAIAELGCGTDCGMGYAIDLTNGGVFELPVGGGATLGMNIEYHQESRLLKAAWTGASTNPACAGFGYFEWNGHGFRTLKRSDPSPPECQ